MLEFVIYKHMEPYFLVHSYHYDAFEALKVSKDLNAATSDEWEVTTVDDFKYLANQKAKAVSGLRPEFF